MTSDIDVGAYIYARMGWVDSWRLQKLTYYAQAWSLTWTGRPIFMSRIEAWTDGPVAPELFKVNKYDAGAMSTDLPGAKLDRLTRDHAAVIDAVIKFYGSFNRPALIELTHSEAPWQEAHQRGYNAEITRMDMLRFYSNLQAIGGAVPTAPSFEHAVIDDGIFDERVREQSKRWAATLERLAQ